MNSSMCITLIGRDTIYSRNPFPFIGKGIRVYKFNLVYMASIKWVVELPFNARLLSSTSDDDKNDDEDSDMKIDDDDSKKGDDTATGFRLFVYDKTKELPQFTPIIFTDTQTTFVVANPEGNPKETYEDVVDQQMSSPPATTTHNLTTNPQHNSIQAKAKNLMTKAKHNKLNFNFKKPTLKKRPHDNQDPPNDCKGEKDKKRRQNNVGESSSKKDKALMESSHDVLTDQPQDKVEELIQNHPNSEWFFDATKKSGLVDAAKERKPNWFDMLLKSNTDQDKDSIVGLSTVMVDKKVKGPYQE
ncbi:hypothetical protein Tco_1034946 [Tanacetum coccineum]